MSVEFSRVSITVEKLAGIVGKQNVLKEPYQLYSISKDTIPSTHVPKLVVRPGNAHEVAAIVRLANRLQLSLWPVSTGKNWGYGAASPPKENTIVLLLDRMNKITFVSEDLAYAVIEPGVTYEQLNTHLRQNNLKLWCDTTDGPPGGSVIGNALERGIGETPYGDHFGNLCGLEIVLPSGELIQTGGGAFQKLKTWNTYKWGVGPYLEGLFSQSNFGIVTKAGIWLMPQPQTFESFTFELKDQKQFPALIDTVRGLALQGILQTKLHIVNDIVGLSLLTQYSKEGLDNRSSLSKESRQKLVRKFAVAPWSFAAGLYGSASRVQADKAVIRKELSWLGNLTFISDNRVKLIERVLTESHRWVSGSPPNLAYNLFARLICGKPPAVLEMVPHMHSILKGKPTEYFVRHSYFKASTSKPDVNVDPARDQCGLIWFAPIAPLTSSHVGEVLAMCQPLFEKYDFDFYVALLLTGPRSVVVLFSIFYVKEHADQCKRAQQLYFELCQRTEAAGYQQYRTSIAYTDRILDCSPGCKKLASTIKASLDPNNILAPGKYGVH
jgi:4-cresol dehydrogenase (hydroxylating)